MRARPPPPNLTNLAVSVSAGKGGVLKLRFWQKISVLAGAAAVAQAAQVVAVLILTAFYEPDAFGALAVASSASAIFAVLVGLQLPFAVSVVQGEERLSLLRIVGVNTLACWLIALPVAALTESAYVIAVMIGAAVCLANALKALAVSEGSQRRVALFYLYRAGCIIALQFAFADLGPIGLTAGLALGETVAAGVLLAHLKVPFSTKLFLPINEYCRTISRHRAFTAFGVLQELVSIFVLVIPFLVADALFSKAAVGNLGMAHRLIYGPASIIGANLGWVVLAALGRGERAATEAIASVRLLVIVIALGLLGGAITFAALGVLRDHLALGEWSLALDLAPYLATAAIIFVASVPYRQAIRVRRKQRVQLVVDSAICFCMVAFALSGPAGMVSWISAISVLLVAQNLALMVYVNRLSARVDFA